MGDHIPLPGRISDMHLDYSSDVALKPTAQSWRPRMQSNNITHEAPNQSRRQRMKSNNKTFSNPNPERSPSPSSRYPSGMDSKEFDRMEDRRLEEIKMRGGYLSESEEVRSLRRLLRERDNECRAQRTWIRDLEREVEQLRQRLDPNGGQLSDARPTYIKVHRKYLATETLEKFDLPWEYDAVDRDHIIIKQYVDEHLQNELFEHTRELKDRERALREREERVLMLEERGRVKQYHRDPAVVVPSRGARYHGDEGSLIEKRRREWAIEGEPARYGIDQRPEPRSDGWRVTTAAETPRGDVERPRPKPR